MNSSFQDRINKLSARQKNLLAKQIGAENGTKTNGQTEDNQSLVAFLVADKPLEKEDLRESLKGKLPDYMIPTKFVQLEEFPKLPNGKIDVNSLKLPVAEESLISETKFDAPQTETEKQLAKIWEEVLSFEPIGVQDNFFEIGGDSILSIQIVAKARKVGIVLAPNQLFEHQTISELARFAKTKTESKKEETITGDVPLVPIQQWFFEEHKNAPHHWNQAMIFNSPEILDADVLQKSVEYLIQHHDALRLNFAKSDEFWKASITDGKKINAFTKIDLTNVPANEIDTAIKQRSLQLQSNLNLSDSTLFQAVFFDYGTENRLLLFAHHLLIDDISWRILLEDLETIYHQLNTGKTVSIPSKTASYKKWGEHLIKLSKSIELKRELEFWRSQIEFRDAFPTDFEKNLPVLVESIKIIESEIDAQATEKLLKKSRATYNTKTEELLITALMLALNKWAGIKDLCLGLEGHGREQKESDLDLSNTVGWFTTYFPVNLKLDSATDLKSSIISTKEKLRNVPNKGLGYGILRYLKQENSLDQKPLVMFNYFGNQKPLESKILGKGEFTHQGTHSPKTERYNLLGINAFVSEGKLRTIFNYSETLYRSDTIKKLIEHFKVELQELIEHCLMQKQSEYTPSDFPEADLNQDDLDSLLNQIS